MTEISRNYAVEIEVLTPLHIGKGVKLQRNYDFVTQRGITYRLNTQAILDDFWPEDPRQQQLMLSQPPSELIRDIDLSKQPKYALYHYRGDPGMNQIFEHIKDVHGHAYIPGSSLKGALRTLLMRTIIEQVKQAPITRGDIGYAMRDGRDAGAAKSAAARLEARYAGPDANHDLFRGISISDTQTTDALRLQSVRMVQGLNNDVEVIPVRTRLHATIRVDRHLMIMERDSLHFEKDRTQVITSFAKAANFTVRTRIDQELAWHFERNDKSPASLFYASLKAELKDPEFHKKAFFLQVGFATGWRAKTLIGGLKDGDPLLEQVIQDFHLDAGGKRKGAEPRQTGDPFPKARHVSLVNEAPALPMGWVKVHFLS